VYVDNMSEEAGSGHRYCLNQLFFLGLDLADNLKLFNEKNLLNNSDT
jgi:hypothetical protein